MKETTHGLEHVRKTAVLGASPQGGEFSPVFGPLEDFRDWWESIS